MEKNQTKGDWNSPWCINRLRANIKSCSFASGIHGKRGAPKHLGSPTPRGVLVAVHMSSLGLVLLTAHPGVPMATSALLSIASHITPRGSGKGLWDFLSNLGGSFHNLTTLVFCMPACGWCQGLPPTCTVARPPCIIVTVVSGCLDRWTQVNKSQGNDSSGRLTWIGHFWALFSTSWHFYAGGFQL